MNDDGHGRSRIGAVAWSLAALLTVGLVVAVGCGDDAGGGASSQGGDDGASTSATSSPSAGPGATSGGGDGGAGATTGAVVASVGPGPGPVSVSASSTTGAGGAPAGCDPPADPATFHGREAIDYATFQPVSMCEYRDQVLLIVNVAAL